MLREKKDLEKEKPILTTNGSLLRDKRAVSHLVGEIILVGCVLLIGMAVWSFAVGYTNSEQTSYWQKVSENIYSLKERFVVENVAFNFTSPSSGTLLIWVYNFGSIDVKIELYVLRSGTVIAQDISGTTITKGSIVKFMLNLVEVSSGNELVIKVKSSRGNINYASYTIP